MRVRIDQRGKVHYQPDTAEVPEERADDFFHMTNERFAAWKGAGKQAPSRKVTDPETGTSYYHDHAGRFHVWADDKANRQGDEVDEEHQERLRERLERGGLLDRRRDDRREMQVQLADVGPHTNDHVLDGVTLSYLRDPAKGRPDKDQLERDHVRASKSIQEASGKSGRHSVPSKEALTVAIPKYEHQDFSPTWGSRYKHLDHEPDGSEKARYLGDAELPARAVYRDSMYMLDQTAGTVGLDDAPTTRTTVRSATNRLRQIGAYRYNFKMNQKYRDVHQDKDRGAWGADFSVPAQEYSVPSTYTAVSGNNTTQYKTLGGDRQNPHFQWHTVEGGKTQGQLFAEKLRRRLILDRLADEAPAEPMEVEGPDLAPPPEPDAQPLIAKRPATGSPPDARAPKRRDD